MRQVFRSVGPILFWVIFLVITIKFIDAVIIWQDNPEKRRMYLSSCEKTEYVVRDGDTLWGIAIYAIDNHFMPESDIRLAVDDITLMNPGTEKGLKINEKIIIPMTSEKRR